MANSFANRTVAFLSAGHVRGRDVASADTGACNVGEGGREGERERERERESVCVCVCVRVRVRVRACVCRMKTLYFVQFLHA